MCILLWSVNERVDFFHLQLEISDSSDFDSKVLGVFIYLTRRAQNGLIFIFSFKKKEGKEFKLCEELTREQKLSMVILSHECGFYLLKTEKALVLHPLSETLVIVVS